MSKSRSDGGGVGIPPALASFLQRARQDPDANLDDEGRVHVDGRVLNPHVSHGTCEGCAAPGRPGYYVLDESSLSKGIIEFVCTAERCDWVRTVDAEVYQRARLQQGLDLPPLREDEGGDRT